MLKDNIIDIILKLMRQVETLPKTGVEKKVAVLTGSKLVLGAASFERYGHFIELFIDFAVCVSKKKINLRDLKDSKCWLQCF